MSHESTSFRFYYSLFFIVSRVIVLLYFLCLGWYEYEGRDWAIFLIISFIIIPPLLTNRSDYIDSIVYKKNEKFFNKVEFTRASFFLSMGLLCIWLLLFLLVPLLDITDLEQYFPFIDIDTKVIFMMLAAIEAFFVVIFDEITKRLFQRKCRE